MVNELCMILLLLSLDIANTPDHVSQFIFRYFFHVFSRRLIFFFKIIFPFCQEYLHSVKQFGSRSGPEVIIFMLNSAEHEIYPAHSCSVKCQ